MSNTNSEGQASKIGAAMSDANSHNSKASASTFKTGDATMAPNSEDSDSATPSESSSDSSSESEDDEESPDLISALLAAASGVPLSEMSKDGDAKALSGLQKSIPQSFLLNNPGGNPNPTIKPSKVSDGDIIAASSSLTKRLEAFLPQIAESNRSLQESKQAGKAGDYLVEESEKEGDDQKPVVEMDLALGVLEELAGKDGTSSKKALVEEVGPK